MSKAFDSQLGEGKYRLTRYKGQLIGIELWPDKLNPDDEREAQRYLVFKFAYVPPVRLRDRLAFWRRKAPDEG